MCRPHAHASLTGASFAGARDVLFRLCVCELSLMRLRVHVLVGVCAGVNAVNTNSTLSYIAGGSIEDCECNAGYTGPDGGPCEACVWGTYKEVSGTAECSLCSAGKYLPASGQTSGSACRACPIHSYSVPGSPDPSMIGQDRVSQNVCFACVDARPQQIGDS